jgi:HD-GYP domain-containing protein (c-di-GMP phosphodiesterase class II)
LAGDQIALESRVITTADIFDALTADRPYRPAMSIAKALSTMSEMVGTAIDPDCFDALQLALNRAIAAAGSNLAKDHLARDHLDQNDSRDRQRVAS